MGTMKTRLTELEEQLRLRGVVDVKFFKDASYHDLTPSQKEEQLVAILNAAIDGNYTPAGPIGDSVRTPITLSPVAQSGGGRLGDHHEKSEKGGTPPQ